MTTLTIEIADKDKDVFLEIVKKFKGKIIDSSKKEKILSGIQQGLIEAREIQEGKRKSLTLKDI
ncbi:hypothetical protein ACFQ3S_16700 [Mucilaginibacter terrae]|uniref:hypothetical protein n=1 Tax=Mucilaginibacter terrae TaxID=1955052 RepID=UPI003633CD13